METAGQQQRLENVSEHDLNNFIQNQSNKHTTRKTNSNIRLLQQFLQRRNENRQIYDIPEKQLDTYLGIFFYSIRKPNGQDYEPSTLQNFQSSFERYLKDNKYPTSIITHRLFNHSRTVLSSKQKQLKKMGKGNKPNESATFTDDDKEILYAQKQLGMHSPMAIINTLWLFFTIHFGMRGVQEHVDLQWGDVQLHEDNTGAEYLEFNERQTKTRTGKDYFANLHCCLII